MRRRSALLEALELLRETNPGFTLTQVMALLYVADEGEPLPLPDLQWRMSITANHAWRTAQALTSGDDGLEPLVSSARWKVGTTSALSLSPTGERLCARLDDILSEASPIASAQKEPADPWGSAGGVLSAARRP